MCYDSGQVLISSDCEGWKRKRAPGLLLGETL